jgi:asparagine synthetase B (glutamine-hydrolysing)
VSLPPLANLFAAYDPDPQSLAALEADLETSGEFRYVSCPSPGWVVAKSPLPGGDGGDGPLPGGVVEFVEGQDVVCDRLPELCRLSDQAPERLAQLAGDFGFIRLRSNGSATVVRSCGGLVPFYLTRAGDRFAVSTRMGDLVRYLPDEPRLDPLVNAVWTSGWGLFPDGRTFLDNVSILDRGCFALLAPGRSITTNRYWDPRPRSLEPTTADRAVKHAQRLRALLLAQLARDLDPDGGNLLTLSGGVDSSSLASLAAGVLKRPLATWSLLPEPEELFQREMSYIGPLSRRLGIERTHVVRLRKETRLELLHAAPPVVFHVIHPALCALPSLVAEGDVRVLFGGEFADEVCGSVFTFGDWARNTTLPQLISGVRQRSLGRRDMLRWTKRRLLALVRRPAVPFPGDLPGFIRSDVREEYRTWVAARRRAAAGEPVPRRDLALHAEADGFVAMNWEAASALGVRRSFPFFNREVLELAFECHPTELVGSGTKKLLRAALRADVPRENLFRADKGHWGGYLHGAQLEWSTPLPASLAAIVRPDWCPNALPTLDCADAGGLAQLTVFVGTLAARRRQRLLP